MGLAAFGLGTFLVPEIVGGKAALGLDDEVEAFGAVAFHQHGPVWIVTASGRGMVNQPDSLAYRRIAALFSSCWAKAFSVSESHTTCS